MIGTVDCTEGIPENPRVANTQSQTYLTYKWRNTWKKLISVTPTGKVSFISKYCSACASDQFITEGCHILDKLQNGENLMTDNGFSISDLLISKGSQLFYPF